MKKNVVFVSMLVVFVVFSGVSFAESQSIYCFDYYEYGVAGVFDNMRTEKVSYAPQDKVIVSYDLISNMSAPIVEGLVRVQIFYDDPVKGEQMIDEFVAQRDLSLQKGDKVEGEFTWVVPAGADSGEYVVKTYLISGDMFNLLGLSILPYGPPGVPGEQIKFDVVNPDVVSAVYLDKGKTTLNGVPYPFGQPSPGFENGQTIAVKTSLVNKGQAKKVDVTFEVYEWDDVAGAPIDEYTKKESVTVGVDGSEDLSYSLAALPPGTYAVKVMAVTLQQKSILKMRISVPGAQGRFIFAGIESFPLVNGDANSIFFCMANSADHTTYFNAKGSVEVVDDKGAVVFWDEWGPLEIVPDPMGERIEFVPDKDVSVLTLKVRMTDDDGNLIDESVVRYDISTFQNIGAKVDVSVDKAMYDFEDKMRYTITYEDGSGTGLNGEVLVYLLDPSGIPLSVAKKQIVGGVYKDDIKLMGQSGEYTLRVREATHDVGADATFVLAAAQSAGKDDGSSTGDGGEQNNMSLYLVLLLIAAIGGYFVMKKRRG